MAKVKQQQLVVPESGVTLKIGDPTVAQDKITVPAEVQSVQKLKLDKLTRESVVTALQKKGLNAITGDQIVVDVAALRKAAALKGVPAPAPECDAIALEANVPPTSELLFPPTSEPEARKLQAALCLLDTPGQPNSIDGIWGRQTKRALKQYQCRTGRTPDGKLTTTLRDELLSYTPADAKTLCAR